MKDPENLAQEFFSLFLRSKIDMGKTQEGEAEQPIAKKQPPFDLDALCAAATEAIAQQILTSAHNHGYTPRPKNAFTSFADVTFQTQEFYQAYYNTLMGPAYSIFATVKDGTICVNPATTTNLAEQIQGLIEKEVKRIYPYELSLFGLTIPFAVKETSLLKRFLKIPTYP